MELSICSVPHGVSVCASYYCLKGRVLCILRTENFVISIGEGEEIIFYGDIAFQHTFIKQQG